MKRYISTGILIVFTLVPIATFAAVWIPLVPSAQQGSKCGEDGGCQSICDLVQLAQNILNDGVILATFLAAILFAWAGARMLAAGGDTKVISSAKKTFGAVFIGFVIVLTAWLIVDTIMKAFTDQGSDFGPWNEICK